MFVSLKDKLVFIHVPKTGGTSIHISLKDLYGLEGEERHDPLPPVHHMSISEFLLGNPGHADFFKFAFVRNPFSRILSGYSEFTQRPDRRGYHMDIKLYYSFEEFCLDFQYSEWNKDPHFRPQNELLCVDGKIAVDYVGKYETLQDNWDTICEKVGLPPAALEVTRKTAHKPYQEHYTAKSRAAIEKYFAEDLALFEYKFE